jgi:hypothetical protein
MPSWNASMWSARRETARFAVRPHPREKPQFVLCRHPRVLLSVISALSAGAPVDAESLTA